MVMRTFPISPYIITFLLSFVISFIIVFILLLKKGIEPRFIGYSMLLNIVLILYGAKLYTTISSGFQYNLLNAGPSSLGGVVGLFIGIFIFGRIYTKYQKVFLQAYTLVIPLMYSIAKIGCYLTGCCHGIPYKGPMAISYHNDLLQGGPYFPIQLTETIIFAIIFLIGVGMYFSKQNCRVVPVTMILCAVGKFSLEYLREEHAGTLLSTNQWVCIGFFLWGIILILQNNKSSKGL